MTSPYEGNDIFIFSLQRIKRLKDISAVLSSQRSRKITQRGRLSILCFTKKKSVCQPRISISSMTVSLPKSSPMLICWLTKSTLISLLCRQNTITVPHRFVFDSQKACLLFVHEQLPAILTSPPCVLLKVFSQSKPHPFPCLDQIIHRILLLIFR